MVKQISTLVKSRFQLIPKSKTIFNIFTTAKTKSKMKKTSSLFLILILFASAMLQAQHKNANLNTSNNTKQATLSLPYYSDFENDNGGLSDTTISGSSWEWGNPVYGIWIQQKRVTNYLSKNKITIANRTWYFSLWNINEIRYSNWQAFLINLPQQENKAMVKYVNPFTDFGYKKYLVRRQASHSCAVFGIVACEWFIVCSKHIFIIN